MKPLRRIGVIAIFLAFYAQVICPIRANASEDVFWTCATSGTSIGQKFEISFHPADDCGKEESINGRSTVPNPCRIEINPSISVLLEKLAEHPILARINFTDCLAGILTALQRVCYSASVGDKRDACINSLSPSEYDDKTNVNSQWADQILHHVLPVNAQDRTSPKKIPVTYESLMANRGIMQMATPGENWDLTPEKIFRNIASIPETRIPDVVKKVASETANENYIETAASFAEAIESGKNNCLNLRVDDSFVSERMLKVVESADRGLLREHPSCLDNLSKIYANLLKEAIPDVRFCQKQPADCEKRWSAVFSVAKRLRAVGLFGGRLDKFCPPEFSCCVDPLDSLVASQLDKQLYLIANRIPDDNLVPCANLTPGDSKVITGYVGTTVNANYRLERGAGSNAKKYTAYINIALGPKSSKRTKSFINEFYANVDQCLKDASSELKGEDGQTVTLRREVGSNSSKYPKSFVEIAETAGARANSENWALETQFDCPTMLHEMMHLMGFSDGYSERTAGKKIGSGKVTDTSADAHFPDFDCRSIAPNDSVMHMQWLAWNQAKGRIYDRTVCRCEKTDTACTEMLEACGPAVSKCYRQQCEAPPSCPPAGQGMSPSGRCGGSATEVKTQETLFDFDEMGIVHTLHSVELDLETQVHRNPQKKGLLYPAEFRMLKNPGNCEETALYRECSKTTHWTSKEHMGTGCGKVLPDACLHPEKWMK